MKIITTITLLLSALTPFLAHAGPSSKNQLTQVQVRQVLSFLKAGQNLGVDPNGKACAINSIYNRAEELFTISIETNLGLPNQFKMKFDIDTSVVLISSMNEAGEVTKIKISDPMITQVIDLNRINQDSIAVAMISEGESAKVCTVPL